MPELKAIVDYFKSLQDNICAGLESLDGSGTTFREDPWTRPGGGGGRTRVFRGGKVIEKGGVNFSHVHGPMPEKIANALGFLSHAGFDATGVSIVLHPRSPYVPIIHMNVRYFEMEPHKGKPAHYWFGGGIDVTPAYIEESQAVAFHRRMKAVCDRFNAEYYPRFKKWCDEYFYLPHRKESRGIGGLFFDKLRAEDHEGKQKLWDFVRAVGEAFVPAYTELVQMNRDREYGDRELNWQMLRRARYVEFNLLHDKGTKFGLDTDGRTESILMSMPPLAAWEYCHQPEAGSPEEKTLLLLKAVDWLGNAPGTKRYH